MNIQKVNNFSLLNFNKAHFYNKTVPNFLNFPFIKLRPALEKDVFQKTSQISFGKKDKEVDYVNTEEFSKYFSGKIREKMNVKKVSEIENIINSVSLETGFDRDQVSEIVSRLTQFSSYKTLTEINKEVKKLDVSKIFDDGYNFSLNKALIYAGCKKSQFIKGNNKWDSFNGKKEDTYVFFVDDIFLKNYRKDDDIPFEETTVFDKVQNGKCKLAVVDGWNVKINGKYTGYGIFDKEKDLKTLTKAVVQKMQDEKCTLDEALNGDITREVKEIFGEDIPIHIIKNNSVKSTTSRAIQERMAPNMPDKYQIRSVIEEAPKKAIFEDEIKKEEEENAKTIIAKYFDNLFIPFSSETICEKLKEQYKNIQRYVESKGSTMDDVMYMVPSKGKSFNLILYQYAKINNVQPEQITFLKHGYKPDKSVEDKFVVILDDMIGSGQTVTRQEFGYYSFIKKNKTKGIIFAPILAYSQGEKQVGFEIGALRRRDKDVIMPVIRSDVAAWMKAKDDYDGYWKSLFKSSSLGDGTDAQYCAVSFPYSAPDNNSGVSAALANSFMNNAQGNYNSSNFAIGEESISRIKQRVEKLKKS